MRICVIGSGVFGIAAVREMVVRLRAATVHWLSADREAGGLWSRSATGSRVYDSLYLNTSRTRSAFTGTSIPSVSSVHFIHHTRYATYLAEVAATCTGARRDWGCRVTSVSRRGKAWLVDWIGDDGPAKAEFDVVVDATGHYGTPASPDVPVADRLQYEYMHSGDYRNPSPYRRRNVLVVGNGASAVDIACDLVPVAASVGISVRTPKWHLPKMLLGRPADHTADGRARRFPHLARVHAAAAEWVVRHVVGSYAAYGLAEPAAPLALSTPVLNDHFLAHLSHGRVAVHPAVSGFAETAVRFGDGTEEKFDAVIAATGFRDSSPHLPAPVQAAIAGLGLDIEVRGFPSLYLMNRFRCGDAAVRCAEKQAGAILKAIKCPQPARAVANPLPPGARVTADVLNKAYEVYE